jgi:arsenical pump membrane protein
VVITSPSDERLLTKSSKTPQGNLQVRAKFWGEAEALRATAHLDRQVLPMKRVENSQVWEVNVSAPHEGVFSLVVSVEDVRGKVATDEIRVVIGDLAERERVERDQDNALEAWPEHGLLGTQLGPNKNGKEVVMIPAEIAHVVLPLIVAVSIALMLTRPRGIPEVWWISGGALLLIALRLVPLKLAGQAVAKGSDVYLVPDRHDASERVGAGARRLRLGGVGRGTRSNGSCSRLFLLVYGVGTLVTIFMSNDATAVVLTPAILTAVRKAKVSPLPYLFVCALIANAASFVLPISNPANLVVFHTGMPPLGTWLADFGVPSLLSILVTFLVMRLLFRDELCKSIECEVEDAKLSGNGKLVLAGLALMIAVLLTASAMKKDLGLPTCLAALVITAVVSIKSRSNPIKLAREISWGTLLLVAGLFVMVDAVESQGALNLTQQWLDWASSLGQNAARWSSASPSGIANNIVNNLPLGLIAGGTIQAAHTKGLMANAVLIGVDLGPNLSVTGSLATILWLLALRKDSGGDTGGEKLDVSFWKFLKGWAAVAMPVGALRSAWAERFDAHAREVGTTGPHTAKPPSAGSEEPQEEAPPPCSETS